MRQDRTLRPGKGIKGLRSSPLDTQPQEPHGLSAGTWGAKEDAELCQVAVEIGLDDPR